MLALGFAVGGCGAPSSAAPSARAVTATPSASSVGGAPAPSAAASGALGAGAPTAVGTVDAPSPPCRPGADELASGVVVGPAPPPPWELPPAPPARLDPPPVALTDPDGALAGFHRALLALRRGERKISLMPAGSPAATPPEPLRIAFYGDSNMTLDLISGALRRALQAAFGDAGHGYVAVGKPWDWYQHQDVEHGFQGEWATHAPTRTRLPRRDYGLGGIVATTAEAGARAWFVTAPEASPVGRAASRFGVLWERRARGGAFRIEVDGAPAATVSTRDPAPSADDAALTGFSEVRVPDGAHRFQVVSEGGGAVRLFGVTLERDVPGVVVDCLGIGGINWDELSRFHPAQVTEQLRARPYTLVMVLLGTNSFNAALNREALARFVALHRAAVPGVSLLVVGPPDHVKREGDSHSDPSTVRIVEGLRAEAAAQRVAFWDLRAAMGGEGSMARFHHASLAAPDFYHFTRSGAAWVAHRLHAALREAHLAATASGCAPGVAAPEVGP